MTIAETMDRAGIIEPSEEVSESHGERAERLAMNEDLEKQSEYQIELAIKEFGDGRAKKDIDDMEMNGVIFDWTSSGFSSAWRQLVEDMAKRARGMAIDYSKITIEDIVEFAKENNIPLTRKGGVGKN